MAEYRYDKLRQKMEGIRGEGRLGKLGKDLDKIIWYQEEYFMEKFARLKNYLHYDLQDEVSGI